VLKVVQVLASLASYGLLKSLVRLSTLDEPRLELFTPLTALMGTSWEPRQMWKLVDVSDVKEKGLYLVEC